MQRRSLPIVLDGPEYRQLERLAKSEERDPLQQARWIIRHALSNHPSREPVATATNRGGDDDRLDS